VGRPAPNASRGAAAGGTAAGGARPGPGRGAGLRGQQGLHGAAPAGEDDRPAAAGGRVRREGADPPGGDEHRPPGSALPADRRIRGVHRHRRDGLLQTGRALRLGEGVLRVRPRPGRGTGTGLAPPHGLQQHLLPDDAAAGGGATQGSNPVGPLRPRRPGPESPADRRHQRVLCPGGRPAGHGRGLRHEARPRDGPPDGAGADLPGRPGRRRSGGGGLHHRRPDPGLRPGGPGGRPALLPPLQPLPGPPPGGLRGKPGEDRGALRPPRGSADRGGHHGAELRGGGEEAGSGGGGGGVPPEERPDPR